MDSSGIYLLDTNTVSYIAIDRSPAARRAMDQAMRHHTIAISAITEEKYFLELQAGLTLPV